MPSLLFAILLTITLLPSAGAAPATGPSQSPGINWRAANLPFFSIIDAVPTFEEDIKAESRPATSEELRRRNALARYLDARLYAIEGRTEEAIQALEKSRAAGGNGLSPQLAAITIQIKNGDLEEALAAAVKLIQIKPQSYEARLALGRVYRVMLEKKPDDAALKTKTAAAFEAARKIEPKGMEALSALGELYWSDFRQSKTKAEEKAAAAKVISVHNDILEASGGGDRLLPLLYLAFTHQIIGQYDKAEEHFQKAIAIDSRNIPAYLQLATLYETQKKDAKVVKTLRDALIVDPGAVNVQERLNVFLLRKSPQALLDFYRELAEEFPSSAEMQKMYALHLVSQGKHAEAAAAYEKVVRLDKSDADSQALRAHLLMQIGQKDEAVAAIRELEKLAATNAELMSKTATLYLEADLPANAERAYLEALKISPESEKFKYLSFIIAFHLHQKQPDKALKAIDDGGQYLNSEQQYDLQLERARVLQGLNRSDESEKVLKSLMETHPEKPVAYLQLGVLYDEIGKDAEAEATYRMLLEKMPKKSEAYIGLGVLYESSGKEKLAEESYQKVLEFEPNNVSALLALGMLYDKQDKTTEAENSYRRAIQLDPQNADALNNLGYLFAARGQNLNEAQKLIERALSLEPGAPHIIDSMGWVLYQQAKYEEAVRYLEAAAAQVGFEKGDAEVYEHLGDAYDKLGKTREALAVYKKALRADPQRSSVAVKVVQAEKKLKATPAIQPADSPESPL